MILTTLNRIAQVVDQIIELLTVIDPLSAAISLIIFWRVGGHAVQETQTLRSVGLGIGLMGFCAFLIRIWITTGIHTGFELANASVRALFCSGFVASTAWILLAIGAFLYHEVIAASGALRRE